MFFRILVSLIVLPLLTQCGSQSASGVAAVTGPFDTSGNYVEDWADAPDRWPKPSAPTRKPQPSPVLVQREPTPQIVEVVTQPDRPTRTQPASVIAQPAPNIVKVTSAPKPKPAAKPAPKPKPKPTPKVTRYTVKRGDSLGRIASNHGSSVSAIRKANGIRGDLIRPGQVLTIPK